MHLKLPDINPVLLQTGPFHVFGHEITPAIRWYALAYIAGIVLGWLYMGYMLRKDDLWAPRKPPLDAAELDDLILWITGGVILGGRIGYILAYDTSIIWEHPAQIFMVWEGGMSFHGGFTGVAVAVIAYGLRRKLKLGQMLNIGDLLASAAPMGLFFGRLANFVNGELWGRATTLPWGMDFCNRYILKQYGGNCPADPLGLPVYRHPSQLYEALGEGVILFVVLYILGQRMKKFDRPGLLMGVFIAGYGFIRILLENVRNPDAQMPDFLKHYITMGMILSVPMVLIGGFLVWSALRTPLETPVIDEAAQPGEDPSETAA